MFVMLSGDNIENALSNDHTKGIKAKAPILAIINIGDAKAINAAAPISPFVAIPSNIAESTLSFDKSAFVKAFPNDSMVFDKVSTFDVLVFTSISFIVFIISIKFFPLSLSIEFIDSTIFSKDTIFMGSPTPPLDFSFVSFVSSVLTVLMCSYISFKSLFVSFVLSLIYSNKSIYIYIPFMYILCYCNKNIIHLLISHYKNTI